MLLFQKIEEKENKLLLQELGFLFFLRRRGSPRQQIEIRIQSKNPKEEKIEPNRWPQEKWGKYRRKLRKDYSLIAIVLAEIEFELSAKNSEIL